MHIFRVFVTRPVWQSIEAARHPISVLGGEHFFDSHHILSCSAVPLFDPFGAIAGVLDLTNASDVPQVHALALLTAERRTGAMCGRPLAIRDVRRPTAR